MIFIDALVDTGKLVPLLAISYFVIAFIEYRYGSRMSHYIMRMGALGPVAGALFGCIPQCGFSVVASALYVKRLISVGTLLAVFLSTSDEAIPILLSMPDMANMVWLLIAIKITIAIIAGIIIDFFVRKRPVFKPEGEAPHDTSYGDVVKEHPGCCSHGLYDKHSKIKALVIHPLWHTLKIFLFLLSLTLIFNIFVEKVGMKSIESMLLSGTVFQPAIASFIGLIPNCFASVLLAELFAKGAISFGSMVAGLCAGAGLGLLVLIKENKDFKDTLFVVGLLLAVSIFVGILIQCAIG